MMQADTPPVPKVTDLPRPVATPAARRYGAFVPNLLLAVALIGWLGFQAFQQVSERQQLDAAAATLAPQEQAATKVRSSLQAVATATAKLANEGNANARAVVEELRKRGVTINPTDPAKQP